MTNSKRNRKKQRYDKLFELTKSLRELAHLPGRNQHKIKPQKPTRFDDSQNLEVVTQLLDDVEHCVGVARRIMDKPRTSTPPRCSAGSYTSLQQRGVPVIPPADRDYGITWPSIKTAFKKQFVPEVAVSVVRKEWHTLKFSNASVLNFNRRAFS